MTTTRQQGNRTENWVARDLENGHGYFCYPSRGSRGIDLICLATDDMELPHLGIEAGTRSKSVKGAFAKMQTARRFPGMVMLVVRKIKRKGRVSLRWHAQAGVHGHDTFECALEEARQL